MLGENYSGTRVLGKGFLTIPQQEKGFQADLLGKSAVKSTLWDARGSFLFGKSTGDLRQQVEMDVAPGLVSSGHHCVQFPGQSWRRS